MTTTKTAGQPNAGDSAAPGAQPTVSHLLGEITWLLSQSPVHRAFRIADLEWLIMPALVHRQFYLFREADRPVGLALWAKCDEAAASKLDRGMAAPENRLTLEEWQSGNQVWLVDLVAPFADVLNQQRELMFADLISGPLKGTEFHFHHVEPSGRRVVQTVPADAGEKFRASAAAAVAEIDGTARGTTA